MTTTIKTNGKTENNGAVAKEWEIGTKMNSSILENQNQKQMTNGNMKEIKWKTIKFKQNKMTQRA